MTNDSDSVIAWHGNNRGNHHHFVSISGRGSLLAVFNCLLSGVSWLHPVPPNVLILSCRLGLRHPRVYLSFHRLSALHFASTTLYLFLISTGASAVPVCSLIHTAIFFHTAKMLKDTNIEKFIFWLVLNSFPKQWNLHCKVSWRSFRHSSGKGGLTFS